MGPPASLPYQERSGHHLAQDQATSTLQTQIGNEDTGGGDELAAKNTGKVQKRQDTKRGYQKGAETTGRIGRQNQKKKADMVWACNNDVGKQTTGGSAIRTSGENKKHRKTTKEVYR